MLIGPFFMSELLDSNPSGNGCDNDVLNGIRVTSKFISQKNILINKSKCPHLLESLYSYVWNEKSSDKGEDKPLKENDHAPDALRYAIYSAFPKGTISNKNDNMTIEEVRRLVYGEENYLNV